MLTSGYPYNFLALISWKFHISVKYVYASVFKNYNELVGIETLSSGFKPANVDDFSEFFGFPSIVIFDYDALVFQNRVIAHYQT